MWSDVSGTLPAFSKLPESVQTHLSAGCQDDVPFLEYCGGSYDGSPLVKDPQLVREGSKRVVVENCDMSDTSSIYKKFLQLEKILTINVLRDLYRAQDSDEVASGPILLERMAYAGWAFPEDIREHFVKLINECNEQVPMVYTMYTHNRLELKELGKRMVLLEQKVESLG
ncbi:hypothetical protein BDK51DRAFT_29003 [Blyttiomyces helicus]|uniref:Uncharacterized protein n=1 Tax=Blyttiomyces helicus TaxID=388810 RepID=A0A4P9WR34_9FUNG|nr:hypothetical protein BDK51DRAFT_29003 [Blyttiomyces helicus]|eukprot:RKO93346.1 hypothetical protein BDK51DRAFT_29003 [Blyttiomyces helicus]